VTIGSAVAIGAVAGGLSRVVVTKMRGGGKLQEKNWMRREFGRGMLAGALGGGLGAGAAHWLMSNDYLQGLFEKNKIDAVMEKLRGEGWPEKPATPPPIQKYPITPLTTPETTVPDAPAVPPHGPEVTPEHVAPTPDHGVTTPPSHEPPSAPHQDTPSAPPVVPQGSLRDILTEEQFEKLPRGVRSLASSTNPREIALFCKEASFELINGSDRSPEALRSGARLIERGLEVAKASGLDNSVTKMLHADYAYLKAWGIGTDKNVGAAINNARQAGTVVHNYGGRLLSLFHKLKLTHG